MTAQQSQQEATTSSQCPAVRHAMIYYIIPALLFTFSSFLGHKMMSILIPKISIPTTSTTSPSFGCAKKKKLFHEGGHDFVAIDGDSAVIIDSYSVLFYGYKNNTWEYSQTIEMTSEPDSVAISGNVAAVGDGYDQYHRTGVVHVFERNANTGMWIRTLSIVPDDINYGARFGVSVDIYDNLMVVGASREQKSGGSVFVYRLINNKWRHETKLLPPGSIVDSFGSYVSIQHNTIAVRGYYKGGSVIFYKYDPSKNTWIALASTSFRGSVFVCKFDPGDTPCIMVDEMLRNKYCDNNFGSSLAFTQSRGIMIGCTGDNDYTGSIYYYTSSRENERFTRQQTIMASDGQPNDRFGSTKKVAVDGNVMAVGAGGKVYIFIMISDNWTEVEIIDDPNEDIFFGSNVALSGNKLLISSYNAVYSYSLEYC